MSFTILGYDVRCGPKPEASEWSPQRRAQFLLNPQIQEPLSVDPSVWASRFACHPMEHNGNTCLVDPHFFYYHVVGLFLYPDPMKALLNSTGDRILAVTSESGNRPPAWQNLPQKPTQPHADWLFLGYDIADSGFISALSNCGYTNDEILQYRSRWAIHLNHHGLFHDLCQAQAFRTDADTRVAEHAPFFVFGLYLVQDKSD